MVIDLTLEVKTANYKVITVAPDQLEKERKREGEGQRRKNQKRNQSQKKQAKKAIVVEEQQCPKCKAHLLKKAIRLMAAPIF